MATQKKWVVPYAVVTVKANPDGSPMLNDRGEEIPEKTLFTDSLEAPGYDQTEAYWNAVTTLEREYHKKDARPPTNYLIYLSSIREVKHDS